MRFLLRIFFVPVLTCAALLHFLGEARALTPKRAPLMTRWAAQVDASKPLPEYPRPQLVRSQWQNLNGIWQFQPGKVGDALPTQKTLSGEIVVPFPVESALSGVMEHHERLWYRRTFEVPDAWSGQQLKLHFGAVDYEAEVFVNGQSVGIHRGGYEEFSFDISRYLKGNGPQELIVRAFDPTDAGGQPRGKQTLHPGGIMYTPTSGIWQTVWLEPVALTSIQNLHLVPDVDKSQVKVTVNANGSTPRTRAVVSIIESGRIIKTATLQPGVETAIALPFPKLWSPNRPFLYNLKAALFTQNNNSQNYSDSVFSYFGMRKISVGQVNGVPRLLLNNHFVFQMGPLDQGFWPDGLYTAPTDAALKFDLETMKKLGFNMVRKHIKVEPARWYYHADKLGLLVWQDMPSPNSYTNKPAPLDKGAFEKQLRAVITGHWNSPSIVMWVIFNENQARHDTRQLVALAKSLDPSRLVNRDSGAGNESNEGDVGDVDDVHSYPPPAAPLPAAPLRAVPLRAVPLRAAPLRAALSLSSPQTQARVCGEYGGIGYAVKGHLWKGDGWGYTSVSSARELEETYGEFTALLKQLRDERGLSAAVYTQITDVEVEVNGLMTYDRKLKPAAAQIALANRFAFPVPSYQELVPTSEKVAQTWKYQFSPPPQSWMQTAFDDSVWTVGNGGFGTNVPGSPRLGTAWASPDIWLRRTFKLGNLSETQRNQLVVRDYHDENMEIFLNGVLAYSSGGYISAYETKPLSAAAQRALVANGENVMAVHCRQTGGGQYIDVGLFQKIPVK